MLKLPIKLGSNNYNILIKTNIFSEIAKYHYQNYINCRAFIVTDNNVKKLYLKKLLASFDKKKISYNFFSVSPGEKSKSFKCAENLANKIISAGINRNDIIYSLGGGIVGDLTGFLSSIILRGLKFIQIPTTLLSQVDSSVGGKTGINTKNGKNMIGTFFQPKAVFIDPQTLVSLSKREFLAGYAEVVKYGLINDKSFFLWLNKNTKKIKCLDQSVIKKIIFSCCKNKAQFVKKDEKESGIRALLNLGHTFAHSIENELDYKVRHGYAVSIGLLMAMNLSEKLKYSSYSDYILVKSHLASVELPINLKQLSSRKKWNVNILLKNMYADKKVYKGNLRFILCNGIGKAFIKENINEELIKKVIKEFIDV